MIKAIFTFIFLCSIYSCFAQKNTIYFDASWKRTTKENAQYYRIAKKQANGSYKVEDHYLDGNLQMLGVYASLDTPEKQYRTGLFKYYTESGYLKHEGNIEKGKRIGLWGYYYEGTDLLRSRVYFKNDSLNGEAKYFDSVSQKLKLEGNYVNGKRNGAWKEYNFEGKLIRVTNFINGILNGECISIRNGEIVGKCYYLNGLLLPGGQINHFDEKLFYSDGHEVQPARAEYDVQSYIFKHLQYPELAIKNKVSGIVSVGFYIETDGCITNVHTQVDGIGSDCNEEAVRVVSHMPKWRPYILDGTPVRTYKMLYVIFNLPKD